MTEEFNAIRDDVVSGLDDFDKEYRDLKSACESAGYDYTVTALEKLQRRLKDVKRDMGLMQTEVARTKSSTLKEGAQREWEELQERVSEAERNLSELRDQTREVYHEEVAEEEAPMTAMQKIGAASVIYDDMTRDMDDVKVQMEQVETIDQAIIESLDRDMERLNRVGDELDGIQADAALARRQIKRLFTNIASNKCVMAILFLVALVFLIFAIVDLVGRMKT